MNGDLAVNENSKESSTNYRRAKKSDDPSADPESLFKMSGYTLYLRQKSNGTNQFYLS